MKTIILTFSLLIGLFCLSQDQTANNGTHEFFAIAKIKPCDEFGSPTSDTLITVDSGIRFNIEYVTSDKFYMIYIFQKTERVEKNGELTPIALEFNKKYNSTDGVLNSNNSKYFLLSFDEYNRCAYKLLKRCSFTVGAATSIIKIRPGIKKTYDDPFPVYFDFGNDFSLGALCGWKFNKERPSAKGSGNLLFGLGTVALSADSLSTRGFLTTPSTYLGLYASIGAVFEYRDFQFGLFTGVDWMTGKTGRNWIYRDRPWIGISMGYSIFKTKKPNSNESNS